MTLILNAIYPSFKNTANTLPASAAITTKDLIGFVLYLMWYIAILAFIRPHRLRPGLYAAFITTIAVLFGILIWAMTANGGVGNLISSNVQLTAAQKGLRFVQCVSTISSSWGGTGDRCSD
jgi:NCS1 family nucleobase:cation symporter-1